MQIPRWFWILAGLLGINTILVMGTSMEKLVRGASIDDAASSTSSSSTATTSETSDQGPSAQSSPDEVSPGEPDQQATELATPDQLQDLQRDPVFNEIKKMFSSPPPAEPVLRDTTATTAVGAEYFERLDRRLATAIDLSRAARRISSEAAELSARGDRARADELLDMTRQLRNMAAALMSRSID